MFRKNSIVFVLETLLLFTNVALIINVVDVEAQSPPVAFFTCTPETALVNAFVIFDASESYDPDGTIVSYTWDFGDGSTPLTIPDLITFHKYTAPGDYNVTLVVTDNEALTGTAWSIVTVIKYPVAYFAYSPTYPIVNGTVTFNATESTPNGGTIISYFWDFGDGNSVNVTVPITTHTYGTEGNHTVILTIKDSENLTDTYSKSISVRDYPAAYFTYFPTYPIVNEMVTFNATESTPNGGTIISYFWDFGDGNNGTGLIVTHAYTATEEYTVAFTITDSEGLTDTAQAVISVRDYPSAYFAYSPTYPIVNGTVTFNATESTPNGGTIVSYFWDFGDGSSPITETDPITTCIYTAFGVYTVTLTITDSEDLTNTLSDTIRILIRPVADFSYSPTKPLVNEMVTFNASDSYDPDRHIVSYTWNFGDGNITSMTDPILTHAYSEVGPYDVTLTITDDDNLTGTTSKLITVYTFLYTHDLAIVSVTPSATVVSSGRVINITVIATNEGTAVETFNVTAYYDAISIGTKPIKNLLPDTEITLSFSFNTTGLHLSEYTISAKAIPVPDETDTADNIYTCTVIVTIPGDVNGDRVCDMKDIFLIIKAYGSYPGYQKWNPNCDINCDGKIDMKDIFICIKHFGEYW